ncbi:MAG: hypothetical protein RR590_00515 [Hungatella sp.]
MSDIMSNVLKVNQPANNGYDNNSVRNNPIVPGDTQIQNQVNPSVVARPDGKTEAENNRFAPNNESNYGSFIANIKDMPQLMELFSKLFITDSKMLVTSGLSENFAEELSGFMEMMKMDAGQVLSFITGQAADNGKFGSVFFQVLRDVLNQTHSVELRTGILDFLKHYSDMSSSDHLMNNIVIELKEMMPYLFKADAEELKELQSHLIYEESPQKGQEAQTGAGGQKLLDLVDSHIAENGRILKEEIIPFFSKYVTQTHDLGKARDIMTLITLNVARYLGGSKESVIQSFEKLLQYGDFKKRLGEVGEGNLEAILNKMLLEQKDAGQDLWTEKLMSLMRSGLEGEGGYESKAVFQNVLNAMLLNESVYMPLLHIMLPVNLDGNIMFSELWVDPDADDAHPGNQEGERNIRILVKFDIKDLGYFDVVLSYMDGKADLLVGYPPKLKPMEKTIQTALGQIAVDHHLTVRSITLGESYKPVSLMDVFPKIAERRNSINVRI